MAITSPSNRLTVYTPVASTGPFPIDFPVFDGTGADLEVQLDGAVVAGWTFTGDLESGFYGEPNTWVNGSISFATPQTGDLKIYGLRAPRRQIAFQEGRGVPARDLNAELDMLTATAQEARRDIGEVRTGLLDLNAAVEAAEDAQAAAEAASTLAQQAYDNFDDRYLGDKTVLPTLDNDGNALVEGALCFLKDQVDPADDGLYRWNGSAWVNISTNPAAFERVEDVFVDATEASTGVVTVPGGYTAGSGFEAKRNGVTQKQGPSLGTGEGDEDDDCTASNGTTVVYLADRLQVGDWLQFTIRKPYSVATIAAVDVTFTPTGGIAATNAQAAIAELDTEKAPKDSPSLATRVDFTNASYSASIRADGANMGWWVGAAGAADGAQIKFATIDKTTGAANFPVRPTFSGQSIATLAEVSAAGLPLGYLAGLQMANNVTDANNDIDFTAGIARDSTNAVSIVCAALIKRLDAVWVVGTNQGGLDTGAKANSTWYHCFAICKADGSGGDFLFSTSLSSPTMPATYTAFRRVGSVRTNGSGNILGFQQRGDRFSWNTVPIDLNTVTLGTTPLAVTLSAPPISGVVANVQGIIANASVASAAQVYRVGQTIDGNAPVARTPATGTHTYQTNVEVDGSSQVMAVATGANSTFTIGTTAYIDTRGRDS
jgi:hypothetical protein